MPKIEVFDPPLCCETGICGAEVDPVLVRFAGDLDDLKKQGWEVARYNPVHTPDAFTGREDVRTLLMTQGGSVLPLVMIDGQVITKGSYPGKEECLAVAGNSVTNTDEN